MIEAVLLFTLVIKQKENQSKRRLLVSFTLWMLLQHHSTKPTKLRSFRQWSLLALMVAGHFTQLPSNISYIVYSMYSKIEGTAQNTHHNRSIVQYGVYERTKSTTNLCTGRTAVIRRIRHSDMFCCSTAAEIGSSPPCRTQKLHFLLECRLSVVSSWLSPMQRSAHKYVFKTSSCSLDAIFYTDGCELVVNWMPTECIKMLNWISRLRSPFMWVASHSMS